MAFGSFNQGCEDNSFKDINMIPFIDIMLVLLIIFIVSAPLLTNSIKIDLPKATTSPNITKVDKVEISILENGDTLVNGIKTDKNSLIAQFKTISVQNPEVHISADKNTKYDNVSFVMTEASKASLTKIVFVSLPE